jgi:hypothetical protein
MLTLDYCYPLADLTCQYGRFVFRATKMALAHALGKETDFMKMDSARAHRRNDCDFVALLDQ